MGVVCAVLALVIVIDLFFFEGGVVGLVINDNSLDELHYVLMVVLTAALVYVAWHQLSGIGRVSKGDFLLRLDERFGTSDVIKARRIIHSLYRYADKNNKNGPKTLEYLQGQVSIYLYKLKNNKLDILDYKNDELLQEKHFSLVLNFLDLLEATAFFCNKGYIDGNDLRELSGDSIKYYFGIYKKIIEDRRDRRGENQYYHFVSVYLKQEKDLKACWVCGKITIK